MIASFKRCMDLVASTLALVLLSPLLILIALLIRLYSRGPVLFTQQRIGRDRKAFRIYKFRSMVDRDPDTIDQIAEGVSVTGRDPRVTRMGRFLRATSLDELPQLLNILKGDMSLVGPRPVLPEQMEVVPEAYRRRFDVRPGLTGLAQVRGRRTLGWIEQLQYDAEYAKRYGIFLDLWLILMTFYVVVGRKGIYGGAGKNWREYREELREKEAEKSS